MKKRLFSLLMALALCLTLLPTAAFAAEPASTVWDGTTATQPSGSGTSGDPYLISTAAELAWLSKSCDLTDYWGNCCYAKLTADIVLNDGTFSDDGSFKKTGESSTSTPHAWTPLQEGKWLINGDNHSISGVYINRSDLENVGFAAYLKSGGKIENLTIKNSYICSTNADGDAGVFAGESWRGSFNNCVGENNILSTSCYTTGGIVGSSVEDSFTNVHTSGSIKADCRLSIAGGLVGRVTSSSSFKNCWNETDITISDTATGKYAGGIAGEAASTSFLNCVNLGSLSGGNRVGGITGQADSNGSGTKLQNCYSRNQFVGYSEGYVGTLCGYNTPETVSLCYAEDISGLSAIGNTGNMPQFTGKGKLTTNGSEDELLNALNENLYEMEGASDLKKWVRTGDGYPLPTGDTFVDTTTYYDIWLGGVRVSSRNDADILKNGRASYDAETNTLTLKDGLTVTGTYEKSLLYVEGSLNLCVEGTVNFNSNQNVGGSTTSGPFIINVTDSGNLKIYAPEGKTATLSVTSQYAEQGFRVNSLTLGGDICLKVRTSWHCFHRCNTITVLSSTAVLDAESYSYPAFYYTAPTVNLPEGGSQRLYEGTAEPLASVDRFTTQYTHIRISPLAYALDAAIPATLTVPMATANNLTDVTNWLTDRILATDGVTEENSTITVSNVVPAVAGTAENAPGTNGSFDATVTVTGAVSKTYTIDGTISATIYPNTTFQVGTMVDDHTVTGDFQENTAAAFTCGDGIVFAVGYTANGRSVKSLTGSVTCFGQTKSLSWSSHDLCYLTEPFTNVKSGTYTASFTIGEGDREYAPRTGTLENISVQGLTLSADDFTFAAPADLTYDGGAKAASVTFTGSEDYSCGAVTLHYYDAAGEPVEAPTAAGTYTVKITVTASDYYQAATTELTDEDWTFTIGKAARSATVSMDGYTYGGTVSTPSVSANLENGAVTYYYNTTNSTTGGTEWKDMTATTLNAGTYYLYATIAATENYGAFTTDAVSFTVGKATPTVTWPTLDAIYVNDTLADDDLKGGVGDGTFSITGDKTWATSGSKTTTVTFTPTDATNYNTLTNDSVAVAVNRRTVTGITTTIPAAITDKDYGTALGDLGLPTKVDILASGSKTFTVPVSWSGYAPNVLTAQTLTGTLDLTAIANEVTQPETAITASTTVTLKELTAGDVTFSDKTETYTGSPISHTLATLPTGVASAAYTYAGTGETGYASSATAPTDAGTYTVTVAFTMEAGYSQKDDISAKLTINKAAGSVTAPTAVESLTYNGAAQTLISAGSSTTGEVQYRLGSSGDYGTALPTATNADSYTVYYRVVGDRNHEDVAEDSISVTIARHTVTITVADKSAYRGSEAPDLSAPVLDKDYTVDGLLGADALTVAPTLRYDPEPDMSVESDTTAIRAGGADAGGNYAIEYVDGKLTITRRPVPAASGKHHITVEDTENGSVTVEPSGAKAGETVSVTVTPDAGYAVEDITITDRNGNKVKFTRKGDKYIFEMPESGVTVKVSFTKSGNPFVDVPEGKYFYDAVLWAVENGITGGTDATHFSPYASCTRGQLVTFLWRAAGEPTAKNAASFTDVAAGRYCEDAVAWAAENGIVGGYDDGTFRPDATITRQQTAAILWRFAKYAGMDVSVGEDTNILSFSDALAISDYAFPAIQWAVGAAVMGGSGDKLLPGDTCTRAQIVTMLYRCIAE